MTASHPYETLDDVVAGLASWEERFRRAQDRRCIFLTLYGIVSTEMRARVARRAFADSEWVHRYAVAFANLYREALENFEAGRLDAVPNAWRLCFTAAKAGTGLVLQDMFLGVNAHVNNDLPLALFSISIDPDRDARYRDHAAVNAVLGAVTESASQRISQLYAPGLVAMDDCAGDLDEILSQFSLDVARQSAWEAAVSLSNARTVLERGLVQQVLGSRAALMARLLLAPSVSPRFIQGCRACEAGPGWLTFVAAIARG